MPFCARNEVAHVGVVKFQNKALASVLVVDLSNLMEDAWRSTANENYRECLEELMSYVIIRCGTGLRGEEVPLTSLKRLCHFWAETREDLDLYIMVTLYSRFKGELVTVGTVPRFAMRRAAASLIACGLGG